MKGWHLTAYALDELDPTTRGQVMAWSKRDVTHATEIAHLERSLHLMRSFVRADDGVDLAPLQRTPWRESKPITPGPWLWVAAAAVIATVAVWAWPGSEAEPVPMVVNSPPVANSEAPSPPPKPEVTNSEAPSPPPKPEVAKEIRPSLQAASAPSVEPALHKVMVRCVREGAAAKGTAVVANRGSLEPLGDGVASITGLQPNDTLALMCVGAGKTLARIQHSVRGGAETVYIPLPALSKPTPPAPPKKVKPHKRERRGPGKVVIHAKPWAKCTISDKGPKTTRFSVEIMSGRHRVSCRKGGKELTKTIRVRAGHTTSVTFDFR